jgi:hypothetical protein
LKLLKSIAACFGIFIEGWVIDLSLCPVKSRAAGKPCGRSNAQFLSDVFALSFKNTHRYILQACRIELATNADHKRLPGSFVDDLQSLIGPSVHDPILNGVLEQTWLGRSY